MKIPRDLSATDFIKILKKLGYDVTRQTGSHIRLTTIIKGQHHVTVPNHDPLRIGTLNGILSDVSDHLGIDKEDILNA